VAIRFGSLSFYFLSHLQPQKPELKSDTVAFSLHDGCFFRSSGDMRTEALRETLVVVVVVEAGPAECTKMPSDATKDYMKTLHISIFY